jgi:hypothetical protein
MKISKSKLRQIIKEELDVISEQDDVYDEERNHVQDLVSSTLDDICGPETCGVYVGDFNDPAGESGRFGGWPIEVTIYGGTTLEDINNLLSSMRSFATLPSGQVSIDGAGSLDVRLEFTLHLKR